jgi:hypothetical protein
VYIGNEEINMLLYVLVQALEDEQEMFLGVFNTRLKAIRAARRYMGDSKDMEFAVHVTELNDKHMLPCVPSFYITANKIESRTLAW